MNGVLAVIWFILIGFNFWLYHKLFDVYYFDLGKGLLKEIIGCVLLASVELGAIKMIVQWLLGAFGTIFFWILRVVFWGIIIILALCLIYFICKAIKNPKETKEKIVKGFMRRKSKVQKEKCDECKEQIIEVAQNGNTAQISSLGIEKDLVCVCSNCGNKLNKDARFCGFCGTKVENEVTVQNNLSGEETVKNEPVVQDISTGGKENTVENQIFGNYDFSTKVQAIKKYRELTGVGLKEAKEAVDRILEKK